MRKDKKHATYAVRWASGAIENVAARSIWLQNDSEPPQTQQQQGEYQPHGIPQVSFLQFMLPDAGSLDSSSSESDIDDRESSEVLENNENREEGDDGVVVAHGRRWTPCASVTLDQAAHVHQCATHFLWPQYLQLGERTFAYYFYLMYSTATLSSTLQYTNNNLQKTQHRPIA